MLARSRAGVFPNTSGVNAPGTANNTMLRLSNSALGVDGFHALADALAAGLRERARRSGWSWGIPWVCSRILDAALQVRVNDPLRRVGPDRRPRCAATQCVNLRPASRRGPAPFGYRSMQFKDYYDTLGVEPSAGEAEIKTAYRRLGTQVPPRRQQGSWRRREVQGRQRGLRSTARPAKARCLRPAARAWLSSRRRGAARRRAASVAVATAVAPISRRSSPVAARRADSATSSRACSARARRFRPARRRSAAARRHARQARGVARNGLRGRQRAHLGQQPARSTSACPRASDRAR